MPNHCYNQLKICSNFDEVYNAIKGEDTGIDFERIIPMPKELEGRDPSEQRDERLLKKYGYDDWYHWRLDNWDTKWNAYEVQVENNTIFFFTAWSPPINVIKTLSKKFPEVRFEYYFDVEGEGDDYGYSQVFLNGEMIKERRRRKTYN